MKYGPYPTIPSSNVTAVLILGQQYIDASTGSLIPLTLNNLPAAKIVASDLDTDGNHTGQYFFSPPANTPTGVYHVEIYKDSTLIGLDDIGVAAQILSPTITVPLTSYSTVADADTYFSQLLYSNYWLQTLANKKQQALNQATTLIDQFAYVGLKTDPLQVHEWPRKHILMGGQHLPIDLVPKEILAAQYEIAKAFNDGFDLEREMRGLRVISRGYSTVRTTYDPKSVPLWLEYGVPSFRAWTYLLAYLDRDSNGRIIIHRVS